MTDTTPVATVYPDWEPHNRRIVEAVRHLTTEQLAMRAGPAHDPIWALVAHLAGTRTYWLCGVFGEPGAEATPFTDPVSGMGWEDEPDHPRSGEELAWALESTWAVVEGVIGRWTVGSLGVTAERRNGDRVQVHTRASVLNRMFSHDAYHVGEVCQVLGVNGLEAIDMWAKPWLPR
jgi:hypothetical protein